MPVQYNSVQNPESIRDHVVCLGNVGFGASPFVLFDGGAFEIQYYFG